MEVSIKAALADLHAGSDVFAPDCPTRVLLDHITSRWGVLILVALSSGTMRWGELRRWARGISEKMLAQTLRTLEADGLVLREQRPVVPPHVDYSLTDRGCDVIQGYFVSRPVPADDLDLHSTVATPAVRRSA